MQIFAPESQRRRPSRLSSKGRPLPWPSRTVGQTVDDVTITAKVKAALLQADDVKGTDINVDTMGGTVTLKGAVESQAQSDRAVTIAKGIEGVKEVKNTLMVKATTTK